MFTLARTQAINSSDKKKKKSKPAPLDEQLEAAISEVSCVYGKLERNRITR